MKILTKDGKEVKDLFLGKVEAGKHKDFEFYLYNDHGVPIEINKVSIPNNEIRILDYPKELDIDTKGLLKIRWSPSITIKKGLHTLVKVDIEELYK